MENGKRVPSGRKFIRSGTWDPDHARQVLDELEASGESVTAFARRRGLSPQRLWWWKKRVGAPGRPGGGHQRPNALLATFIPVTVKAAEPPVCSASLELGGGVRLDLHTLDGNSAQWVARMVRALGDAP